jgi:hypothetical protein
MRLTAVECRLGEDDMSLADITIASDVIHCHQVPFERG